MGWTRRMPLGTITVLTAAFAWSLWCWTIGLPVLGAASTDCGTLHAGTRRWLCDAFSRPLSIDGTHQIPARVVVALLFLLIAVTLARTIMMNSRDGPIQLTDITLDDQGDGTARSPTARANSVDAIIRECLHRTGVGAHGVIPAYSGIDVRSSDVQGPPGYPTAMGLLTRVSVAWIQSGVFNLGWRVTITQTPASPPYRCGLTYSIQRAATGAIELTDSCWGSDVEDCARRVGYH